MADPAGLFWLPVTLLGLIVGSFLSAVSYRLPRGEDFVSGRSRCPSCGHSLGPAELIPVLSWLLTRGKCRACGTKVSLRYPIIELACAGIFMSAWSVIGPQSIGTTALWAGIGACGLLNAIIWIEHRKIIWPPMIIWGALWAGLALQSLLPTN